MSRQKGENWQRKLREWLTLPEPPDSYELRERTQDGSASIETFKIPDGWTDDFLWGKVGELVAAAQDDANNSETGRRHYILIALDASGQAIGRSQTIRFFAVRNDLSDEPGSGLEIEAANPKGLLGQLMRHTEAMVRTMQMASSAQIQGMTSLNERLIAQQTANEDKRLQMMLEMEQMISERAKRELEERRQANQERRLDELMGQLTRVLPALTARLLPSSAVQADASSVAMANAIEGVLDGLPSDKQDLILQTLGPQRASSLIELVGLIQQVKAQNQQGGSANAAQ